MTFRIFGLLVAGLIASSPAANADVIYDNVGTIFPGNLYFSNGAGYAFQFTAGSTAYASSVDAALIAHDASAVTVTMRLYSDSGSNTVGTLLETFQLTSDVFPDVNPVTASMSGSTLLTSGTKYWLEATSTPAVYWYTSNDSVAGTYAFFNTVSYQYVNSWTMGAFRISGVPTGDSAPPQVSNVSATPDPQTYNGDVLISADVTDQTGVASVEYTIDGGSIWTAMAAASGDNYTATLGAPFVGEYTACVRATDTATAANTSDGTACDTFDVTAAQLQIAFAGPELDLDGTPTDLEAQVTGPCAGGAEVEFFADLGSGDVSQGKVYADMSGVATKSVNLPAGGIYEIKVVVADDDMSGDSKPECLGDMDTSGITVVADPNASSTGGGWYKVAVEEVSPRVNFGYTAQSKYNKKLGEYSTKGSLVWMHQDQHRLKGVITEGGKLPVEICASEFAACAAFGGEGTLYEHNLNYDPLCLSSEPCGQEWINGIHNTPFVIFVNDGGTSRVCVSKKNCKEVEKPDQFGIEIDYASVPAESKPVYLNGGNLVVK